MKVSNTLFTVVVIVVMISLLCISFYPSVQDYMATNNMWNGMRDFSDEFNAREIDSLDELPSLPRETTLMLIPYIELSDEDVSKVKRFLNDGGILLLADDYGYGNNVLEYLELSLRFSNAALLDPLFCYKNQRMPRVTDFIPEVEESGIQVVMLNHGTALTGVDEAKVIAWSSSNSFLDVNGDESRNTDEPGGPFPIAARYRFGKGTVVIVSDPSIMINSVVSRDDNYSFIEYLTSPDGQQSSILIDTSHLTKAPLDVSKTMLTDIREVISSPYALLGIVALVCAIVFRYTLKEETTSG
ncbi:DUF4350 domain-containing protein [Chloroflexota bacterium]